MNILVAGATGTVGHHLAEQLAQAGHHVRALTRNASKAKFSAGVEVIQGDLTQPQTFAAALDGVEAMHLITFGGDNFAPLETGAEIVAMAEKAGVRRVTVLTNGQPSPLQQAVESSSLAWTILLPVEFMSNIMRWSPLIQAKGEVRQPYGDRKTAIVHEADIASVAASALTEDGHGGKTYSISGPEVLTPRAMTRIIGEVTGREVRFVELTPDQAREEWMAAGIPEMVVNFILWAYANTPEHGYTVVSTTQELTGRPPRSFAQWVAENRAAFGG